MTDDRAVGAPERLDPRFLLTGLIGSLRGAAGGFAFIAYLFASGQLATGLMIALLLLAVSAAMLFVYWRRFEYRVGANEIRIDSGIVSRTHRSIPFDRIQDVDITQRALARLFGLAAVRFETGGSAGADEGALPAIRLARAEQLRQLVRARRAASAAAAVPGEDDAGADAEVARAPVYAMTLGRVVLAGLFNFSLALFAGLVGLTQTFGEVLGFDPLSRAFWLQLMRAGDPIAAYVVQHRVVAGIAGLALLVVLGLLTGIVRTVTREYGFRLDRTQVGLRRRRGLLTRTDVTLPAARAQAAIIASGPVRAAFGWSELKLQSLAQDEGSGDHVLAPLARGDEVGTILGELNWQAVPDHVEWQRVSLAYVWSFLLALTPVLILAAVPPLAAEVRGDTRSVALPAALVTGGAVIVLLLTRVLAWRTTGYWFDGDRLLLSSGWWRRKIVILPSARIQSIDLRESALSRMFGTATLVFGVAGAAALAPHLIPALPRATAREVRGRLLA
jgi:putative membrane protein